MNLHRHRVAALLLGAALSASTFVSTPAAVAAGPTDSAKSAAAQAVIDGTATPAQRRLVATDPSLAATVPVTYEESPTVVERTPVARTGSVAAKVAAAATCPSGTKYVVTASKYVTAKSTLGFTTFKYHHKVKYCESGTKFLKFLSRSQWFTDEDWVVNVEGLVTNSKSIKDGRGYSNVKRKVIITNFLGDDWVIYPWISGNFKPNDINWKGNPDNQF